MKKIKFTLILLLMSLFSFAQEYPKLYSKQQRLYLITEPQLKTTIKMGIKIDMCVEKLELCKNLNKIKDERINLLNKRGFYCEEKIEQQKSIINQQSKQLQLKEEIIKEKNKEIKNQKVKKIVGVTVGIGLGFIGGVVTATYLVN